MKIPAQILIGGALMLAVAGWCLYLLIPTREWVHVGSCMMIPGIMLAYAVRLARRGSDVAGPVMWMGLLVVMSYLSFAGTVAELAGP